MKKIIHSIISFFKFVTVDIWRITIYDEKGKKGILFLVLKTIVLTIRNFFESRMQVKASALTYYSVFALIPIMAFIFGIARGFGFDSYIVEILADKFSNQGDTIKYLFEMVESYLNHAKGGIFVGIGVIFLLWSMLNVFTQIEKSFNEIWKVKKHRSFIRKFTDYFSLMLLVPFMITISSGITFYFRYIIADLHDSYIISPALKTILFVQPYFTTWLIFTLVYIIVPNTKVKLSNAAIAGLVSGITFQLFQHLYVYVQTWMTAYNAVYGGLAAIPFLLLFLQISWIIVLFGAELSFAGQTVRKYEFETDIKSMSHRYYEFMLLSIAKIIIERFEKGEKPLSVEKLSDTYKLPIRLVSVMTDKLCKAGILIETLSKTDKETTYQPAMDINKITVAYFFNKIDTDGSECFKLEERPELKPIWEYTLHIRETVSRASKNQLIKDL
jgi:membrane protein